MKKRESLLDQGYKRLDLAVKGAELGLWEYNLINKSVSFNETWVVMLGYAPEDLVPALGTWENLIHPNDLEETQKALDRHITGETEVYSRDFRMKCKDGSWQWIHSTGRIIQWTRQGTPYKIAGIHQDIHRRKTDEIALELARRKAVEGERLKTAFLENLSHEIRTPMNGIIGFSEMLRDPNMSTMDRELFLDIVIKSSQQLLSVVNDLLSLSRLESEDIPVVFQIINISELFQEIENSYRTRIEKKGLVFLSQLKDSNLTIHSDYDKIFRTLGYLIENALKFTQEGFIKVGCRRDGRKVLFFVKDTGIGIAEEFHKSIFEKFHQGPEREQSLVSGSGVGLSLCKGFIEKLHGSIWVESEENQGAVFYFSLS